MKNIRVNKLSLICMVVLSMVISMSIACSNASTDFKTLTVRNSLCSFSFEYPEHYKREGPTEVNDAIHQYTGIRLLAKKKKIIIMANPEYMFGKTDGPETVTSTYTPVYITIFVHDASERNGTAKEDVDRKIKINRNDPDFEILETTELSISGLPANQVIYTINPFELSGAVQSELPKGEMNIVVFDYAGLIWRIEAEYEEEMIEQVRADLAHIIQTFQILE